MRKLEVCGKICSAKYGHSNIQVSEEVELTTFKGWSAMLRAMITILDVPSAITFIEVGSAVHIGGGGTKFILGEGAAHCIPSHSVHC